MSAFLDAALGFPAVIFTILLVPVILYWVTVVLGVVDLDLDGDLEADLDADAGGGEAGSGSHGLLTGWWHALGLGAVPLTVALSLIVALGWFVALVLTGLAHELDLDGLVRSVVGLAALALAFAVGALGAAVAGRPLSRLFAVTHAEGRHDFVGRTCVIRTERVTADFGQAEAADPTGATVLLAVRTLPDRSGVARPGTASTGGTPTSTDETGGGLRYGATALIVDYDRDAEVFLVTPFAEELGAT